MEVRRETNIQFVRLHAYVRPKAYTSMDAHISVNLISVDKTVINELHDITKSRKLHKNHAFLSILLKVTSRGRVHTSKLVANVCCEYLQLMQYQRGH